MAPGAKLLLVETPVAETIGVHGFPQIVAAATKGETGIVDVTTGVNTVTWVQNGHTYTVPG